MNPVKEATNAINELLGMVGEEPITMPKEGSTKQRLETLFEIYTDRLISKNPQYKKFNNKNEIPDLAVMYLKKMLNEQESKK